MNNVVPRFVDTMRGSRNFIVNREWWDNHVKVVPMSARLRLQPIPMKDIEGNDTYYLVCCNRLIDRQRIADAVREAVQGSPGTVRIHEGSDDQSGSGNAQLPEQ